MTLGMGVQVTRPAMGTVMTHKVFGRQAEECLQAVCDEIERLEGLLSRFLPASDIARINASAGLRSERVSPETCEVLSKATAFSRDFPGCFDITIEPLVALWNIGRGSSREPEAADLAMALSLVDYRDLALDPWGMTAGLRNPGQALDLGGIGKGYAADRVHEIFMEFGVTSAYANLGGNVVTRGARPDGGPWRIGIQHPRQEGQLIGTVAVVDQSVVTSGDYQRYFTGRQGVRRHHILDPKSGYPAQSGLASVSIVAEKSLDADALSTIVFVAGLEKGAEFLKDFPQVGAILVDVDMQVYMTRSLQPGFIAGEGIGITVLD